MQNPKGDVNDSDNIDMMYVLESHGWSTCILFIRGQIYNIGITHIFNDPISELLTTTVSLLNGSTYADFTWWDEPGTTRWTFQRDLNQHHKMLITIWQSPSFGEVPRHEELLVQFEIKISHFAGLVYHQMMKLRDLLKEPSYRKAKPSDFLPGLQELALLYNSRLLKSQERE